MNESTTTPASAAPAPRQDPPKWFQVLVGIGVVIAVLWGFGACVDGMSDGMSSASTARSDFPSASALQAEYAAPVAPPAPPAPPALPAGPATSVTDGLYLVGEDIEAGTYKTTGEGDRASGRCYWERLSGTDGDMDSLITNYWDSGPSVVTIKKSDVAFKASGGCRWTKTK